MKIFDAVYKKLGRPVPYTGGLLLGNDFIEELYVHMGFHPAWKYRTVHELVFRDGELVEAFDRSEKLAEMRRELLGDGPLRPGFEAEGEDIVKWIENCLSREYPW